MHGQLIDGKLTESVIGAFYDVYNTLGFGFLEHIYMKALERDLLGCGHRVAREVCVPIRYKGQELARQRIDMIVDERLIVEAKSTYELHKAAPRLGGFCGSLRGHPGPLAPARRGAFPEPL